MENWAFPHGRDLSMIGINNADIEHFKDNPVDELTREIIQNSLDAHNPNDNNPVVVKFNKFYIETSSIPNTEVLLNQLDKASRTWKEKGHKETVDYLENFKKVLNKRELAVLKVSDYNTVGLDDETFGSLVLDASYSKKLSDVSAGSKGIGKAAPFAASDIRLVFYNSVSQKCSGISAGVLGFVSFYLNENEVTQGKGFYYDKSLKRINRQFSFDNIYREKNEYGTDVNIVGFNQDNWKDKVIFAVLKNFLVAIHNGLLVVHIENKKIDKDSLPNYIYHFDSVKTEFKDGINKVKNFYEVLANNNAITYYLDKSIVEKYGFIDDEKDAVLLLLKQEQGNRTVLQTRKSGMSIYERKSISGSIGFSGVFQATGTKLNKFLVKMENAHHNYWSSDRLSKEERKNGKKFLDDLFKWFKQCVKSSFGEESVNEIDAFGMKNLIPLYLDSGNNTNLDSGILKAIERFEIKDQKISGSMYNYRDIDDDSNENELMGALEEIGFGDGEGYSFNSEVQENKRKFEEKSNGGVLPEGNKAGISSKLKNNRRNNKKKKNNKEKLHFKLIEINAVKGEYKIVGKALYGIRKIDMSLKCVGSDGTTYTLKINEINTDSKNIRLSNNFIEFTNLRKGEMFNVRLKINSNLRIRMVGEFVEN